MFDDGRDGLSLASSMGFIYLIAELDALMMVSFIDSAVKDYPSFISLVDDYKDPNTRCVSWPQRRNGKKKNFHDNQCL